MPSGGPLPAGLDFAGLLESSATRAGERRFLRWRPFEAPAEDWTYARFLDEVRRVAGGLSARGVKSGDRVLLASENSPEFLVTWFACAWIGAVCVAVHPRSAGAELSYFADATGVVGAVAQLDVADRLGGLRWIESTERFDALRAEPVARSSPGPTGDLGMMFTSGTTSRPKAVRWKQANGVCAAREGAAHLQLTERDVVMLFLPLYHVVGLAWTLFPALWAGAEVVLQPKFTASRFWDVAREEHATVASHVVFSSGVLSRMPVPPSHDFRLWGNSTWLPEFEKHFGVPLVGWWGMTELVAPGIVGRSPLTPGAIGRAAPGYQVRVLDDQGRDVAPGEAGELRVRGERGVSLFADYWGDAKATAEAFDEQGYFLTGDRMRRNPDGSLTFVERLKDVIKVGGEGVSAAEVERVIRQVEGVADVAVVGKLDPAYGEVCVAFVVAAPGAADVQERAMARCRADLAKFKVPREVRLIAELPRANLNKVAKGELRRLATSAADAVPSSGG